MKLNIIDEDTFYIQIIDNEVIEDLSKEELSIYIKKIILRLKDFYDIKLSGFYEIIVFPNPINNIFKFTKIDGYTNKTIDLRIIISDEEHIYLRTECLDVLLEFNEFFTDKNYYYVDSEKIDLEKNLHFCEFFDIILPNELNFRGLGRFVIKDE